ncbi:E3 ubiquitin-protein ligase UHRF1 isoform X4 [Eurytemora carolleeae]|uniref:E3 ubiquitin-protein ligase UHRF1 isoform X4 n=2 Tax=Eurytemora carolleeae TaxID=1294199 RepID=UPI000C75CE76|nr:E3 ubiquitin-protein ligase UHRF1 isoform X4 [Eurytemora carolleeae]|eukprot:XP_023332891.1 E3 ubiquitin-protein ligase UHRF1-like isoform X4 [Eurytemora affinis]
MPRQVLGEQDKKENSQEKEKEKVPAVLEDTDVVEQSGWKVGAFVDALCSKTGAWFLAQVLKVSKDENSKTVYTIKYTEYEGEVDLEESMIRDIATVKVDFNDIKIGETYIVNYNMEHPDKLGFWYDAKVAGIKKVSKTIICSIRDQDKCIITNLEIYKVPGPDFSEMDCDKCLKNPARKCVQCGCRKCGGKHDEANIIMCDECNSGYHTQCLGLACIPDEDEWFCPNCKNENDIVCAGGKSMTAKDRKTGTSRDWGRGLATEGRSKECTIVPKDHFGPIPGIEVGMCWQYRLQVSEEGIHRPPVAGIAGSAKGVMDKRGCQSIVLSGGYEDDVDNGDSFTYTGSGGRDLSGNKRTAEQSKDQALDRSNEAIAYSCMVRPVSSKGGDAGERWREGKPVRVVRAYKAKKHSTFAPEEGFRYDGIYKVKRYWQAKGQSNFKVWRYEFIRDDPSPAPWTDEGKAIIEREGYVCIKKNPEQAEGKGTKRKASNDEGEEEVVKKRKLYDMSDEWKTLIAADTRNKKMWDQVLEKEMFSRTDLLNQVKETLTCQICYELPNQ